jgi:hypothetical protein
VRPHVAELVLVLAACSVEHATLTGTSSGGSGTTAGGGGTTGVSLTADWQQAGQGEACDAGGGGCESTPNEIWMDIDEADGGPAVCPDIGIVGATQEIRTMIDSGDGFSPVGVGQYAIVPWGQNPATGFAHIDLVAQGMEIANAVSGQLNITQMTPTLAGDITAVLDWKTGASLGTLRQSFDATWCAPAPTVDGGQEGGTADAGDDGGTTDAGDDAGCDIDVIASQLAGDGGEDCGQVIAGCGFDAGELAESIACALLAQDAGRPFHLHVEWPGGDTLLVYVYVRSATGDSFQLVHSFVNVAWYPLHMTPCGAFVAVQADICVDGGVPDISCESPGASACVCPNCQ